MVIHLLREKCTMLHNTYLRFIAVLSQLKTHIKGY